MTWAIDKPRAIVAALLIVVLYGAIGGLHPWHYRKLLVLLIPFAIVVTVLQILVARAVRPLPAVSFFGLSVPIFGIERGVVIALRAVVMAISFALFMMSTSPLDLAQAGVRMGIPFRYAFMFSFALRWIPLMDDLMNDIRQAQASRGLDQNRFGPLSRIVSLPALLFPLILSSVRDVQLIAIALEMRGLSTADLYGRTYLTEVKMRAVDWFLMSLAVVGTLSVVGARIIASPG